jgi:hypothetical protein
MTRFVPAVLLLGAVGVVGWTDPAGAQTADCKSVTDAMLKMVTTPHHTVSTDGSQTTGETIGMDNTLYVRVRGVWHKSPMTPQDQLQQEQENIRNAKVYTCTVLRSETVNGVATTVYRVHSETPDVGTADGTVWIAPSLGLPVKTDEDFTPTGGSKVHHAIAWDYTNIHAPVVK